MLSKLLLSGILISAIIFSSCSKNDSNVFNKIPETAIFVVSFHPGQLIEKGKLQEIQMIKEEASQNEISKKILEDPESSGIIMDAYSAFFSFYTNDMYGCFIMPLKSKSDFKAFLEEVAEEADMEFASGSIGKNTTESAEDFMVVYDNDRVMILSNMNGNHNADLKLIATSLIEIDKENILKTDKDFNNFLSKQKDINIWASTNNLEGMPGIGGMGGSLDLFGGVKNNYVHAFADFQNGNMTFSTNLRFNQSLQETIDKYNFLDENAIKDLLKYLPSENVLIVGNTNVDPEKMFDLLTFVNRDFKETIDEMTSGLDLESDELKSIFSGEIAFSLNGINIPSIEKEDLYFSTDMLPTVVFANRINNKKNFAGFLELAKTKAELQEKDGYFEVLNKGIPVYILVNDEDLVMSNNETIIREIIENNSVKVNVLKSTHAENLTNNPICFYLNLDESTYTEEMQKFFKGKMGGEMEMGMKTFGSSLKSLTISANIEEWEFRVDLKDDSVNSLYSLLSQAGK
ncbi:MAG: DUF4836 family protein [Bacteroidales bacterium]|nr:DUF4836 family protein [Bacteroidales bacterium]MCF8389073.1 DUF4836 family protein [Bacteroidales bacterium]